MKAKNVTAWAITTLLILTASGAHRAGAQTIDFQFELPDLRLLGANADDLAGAAIASGDIDGDGRDDIILGCPGFDYMGRNNCGAIFIVSSSDTMGSATGDTLSMSATRFDVTRIFGPAADAALGRIITCGKVTGGTADDIVCGVPFSNPEGRVQAGTVYLIDGDALTGDLDLASGGGFTEIQGAAFLNQFGSSVSVADIDDDGFGDILSGAPLAGASLSGTAFIIRGSSTMPSVVDLNAANSFVTEISGENAQDAFGTAVYAAEVTGDSFADIIVGSPQALGGAGTTYIIPGVNPLPTTITTAGNTGNGIVRIAGPAANALSGTGFAVGDITDDGIPDLVISAPEYSPLGRAKAGAVYIVPGSATWPENVILDTTPGITRVEGRITDVNMSRQLAIGDIDGDEIDDVAIGVAKETPAISHEEAGTVFVVFGNGNLPGVVDLAAAPGGVLTILGDQFDDRLGSAITSGDIDGDQLDDLLIGAPNVTGNSKFGQIYTLYGANIVTPTLVVFFDAEYRDDAVRVEWILIDDLATSEMTVRRKNQNDAVVSFTGSRIARIGDAQYVLDDSSVQRGQTYTYQVTQREDGEDHVLFEISVTTPPTASAALLRNYPNPFAGQTTFSFDIPENGRLSLRVYDVSGALVTTLFDQRANVGTSQITWNGRDARGKRVPTGIYFVQMDGVHGTTRHKISILR